MATLVYNPGLPDEKCFAIGAEAVAIGRAEDQAICIPHRSLSRSHARIEPAAGRFFISDLDSKNGTLVNGARVQRCQLAHGDTVTLGDLDLVFRNEPPSVHAVSPPRPRPADHLAPQATRALLRSPLGKLPPAGPEAAEKGDGGARAQSRLRTLIEVTKLLPVSDDLDELLRKILDLVFQILDVDRAVLLLHDEKSGELAPRAVRTARPVPEGQPLYSQNIVQYVLRQNVAALFTDATADPRLDSAQSVALQAIRASMCAPLKPRDDLVGVLYVDNLGSGAVFSEDDLEFLLAFASQAAVAIENAALYRRLEAETVARMGLIMEAKLASLGAMVAGIAHELRNPLNFMTNFAELSAGLTTEIEEGLAAQRSRLPEGALADLTEALGVLRENTGRISEHGRRADAIIHGMLQHARRSSSAREPCDLRAVVGEGVRLAREGLLGKGFDVIVVEEHDPAVGSVEIARLEIGRVVLNVVENALYAMREKARGAGGAYAPELRVHTEARGTHVEVRIRDNGTGIPADVEARLFEPFFTTKPSGQGTGLGLSMSHEIVVQGHQGTMRVETVAGEYAEIILTLPRATATRPSRSR